MNDEEVKRTVYTAVWRIIRQLDPPPFDEFMDTTAEDTFNEANPPDEFEDFWWESIGTEIQGGVMAHRVFAGQFPPEWVRENKDKTWGEIAAHVGENLIPIHAG